MARCRYIFWFLFSATSAWANAADMRAHVRIAQPEGTVVNQSQASELSLTLTETAMRPIQTWVRVAGTLSADGKLLTASAALPEAGFLQVGQRARVFAPDSKSSMQQAKLSRLVVSGKQMLIEATLAGAAHDFDSGYVLEIVTERGEFLSIPNEAIIEEGDKQVVYVQDANGEYQSRIIETGLQGERYTHVLKGIEAGEQVVTTGSFFIDADYKMKGGN